jgi:hypothetical protein
MEEHLKTSRCTTFEKGMLWKETGSWLQNISAILGGAATRRII